MPKKQWNDEDLIKALPRCYSWAELTKALGGKGFRGERYYISHINRLGLNTSHFTHRRMSTRKWTDEQLIEAVSKASCWKELYESLGVHSNSKRIKSTIKKYNLDTSHFTKQTKLVKESLRLRKQERLDWLREEKRLYDTTFVDTPFVHMNKESQLQWVADLISHAGSFNAWKDTGRGAAFVYKAASLNALCLNRFMYLFGGNVYYKDEGDKVTLHYITSTKITLKIYEAIKDRIKGERLVKMEAMYQIYNQG
jgi:hypothetical protein